MSVTNDICVIVLGFMSVNDDCEIYVLPVLFVFI